MSSPEAPVEDAANAAEPEPEAVETDEVREALLAEITAALGADAVVASHIAPGQDLWVRVATPMWADLARVLRDLGFHYFTFLSAIDWMPSPYGRGMDSDVDVLLAKEAGDGAAPAEPAPIEHGVTGGSTRFEVFARVYSIGRTIGLTLKTEVPDETMTVETWTGTYAGADWHEREAWEMFGITFDGHPGLRHIYLPGEFEGNPLRKDFPLLARHMKPWPGIVDVEPMPGDDAADEASDPASDDAAAAAEGE